MAESWTFDSGTVPVAPDEALDMLGLRIAEGKFETWLTSSSGRRLAVVSNA
ncbi:hypothetical protein ACIRP2_11695 [Streptomyces sp. NPDC101194]|uniref:hypothetical protein n=1 Tax=Streptomyces sp. NPDC101194 TaxID=3366127 RepID=UPI00381E4968